MAEYNYNARHTTILISSNSRNIHIFPHHKNYLSYSSVILLSNFLFSLFPHKFPHLPDVLSSKPHTQIFSYYDQFPRWLVTFYTKQFAVLFVFSFPFRLFPGVRVVLVGNSVHLSIRIVLEKQP